MAILGSGQPPSPAANATGVAIVSGDDVTARRLASAVARGDEAAFRELYDAYQQRLFRFALVLGRGDDTLAHETVQSVFLTAAAKLRPVENEEHLWNWLARVARQNLAKYWRQQERDAPMISMAEVPNCAESGSADSDLEKNLDAALLTMEASERKLIEWFYLDGLSQKDIAEKLGLTPKAVSSRLERARARLRVLVAKNLAHET